MKGVQKKFDDLDIILLRNNSSNEVPEVKLIFDSEIAKLLDENPAATPENLPP